MFSGDTWKLSTRSRLKRVRTVVLQKMRRARDQDPAVPEVARAVTLVPVGGYSGGWHRVEGFLDETLRGAEPGRRTIRVQRVAT